MCFRSSAISGDQSPLEIEWEDLIQMLTLTRRANLAGNHEVFCIAVILAVFRAANMSAESDMHGALFSWSVLFQARNDKFFTPVIDLLK